MPDLTAAYWLHAPNPAKSRLMDGQGLVDQLNHPKTRAYLLNLCHPRSIPQASRLSRSMVKALLSLAESALKIVSYMSGYLLGMNP